MSSCVASVYVRGPGLAGPGRLLAWGHIDGHAGVTDRSVEGGEDERGRKVKKFRRREVQLWTKETKDLDIGWPGTDPPPDTHTHTHTFTLSNCDIQSTC